MHEKFSCLFKATSAWFSFRLFLRCLRACIINNLPGAAWGCVNSSTQHSLGARQLGRAVPTVPLHSQISAVTAHSQSVHTETEPLSPVELPHSAANAMVVCMGFGAHLPEQGVGCVPRVMMLGVNTAAPCCWQCTWIDSMSGAPSAPQRSRGASVCTQGIFVCPRSAG